MQSEPEPVQTASGQLSLFGTGEAPKIYSPGTPVSSATQVVSTREALAELVQKLENAEMIAFDTETTSTDEMQADLVGISLAFEEGTGYYIPIGHSKASNFRSMKFCLPCDLP